MKAVNLRTEKTQSVTSDPHTPAGARDVTPRPGAGDEEGTETDQQGPAQRPQHSLGTPGFEPRPSVPKAPHPCAKRLQVLLRRHNRDGVSVWR